MDYDAACAVNPELEDTVWELDVWLDSHGYSVTMQDDSCDDCGHGYGGHSRGDNGPCVENAECMCVGFLLPPEYGRPSAPRLKVHIYNGVIDGYWE